MLKFKKYQKYIFKISGKNPDDLSLARIGEYLVELGKLFGSEKYVHFESISEGCVELTAKVDPAAGPKITQRLESVHTSKTSSEIIRAMEKLEDKLAADKVSAQILRVVSGNRRKNVLQFKGHRVNEGETIGPIREYGHIDGKIILTGGKDDSVPIWIRDKEGRDWKCTTTVELAQKLAGHLLSGYVRVHGYGDWIRLPDGIWQLTGTGRAKRFEIQSFEILDDLPLSKVIDNIRELPGNGWLNIDDPLQELARIRHGDDEIH